MSMIPTVASGSVYSEMWADPKVVAALSNGVFTYVPVDPWNPTKDYVAGDAVLDGDETMPYGGYIWTTATDLPAGSPGPLDEGQTVWVRDDEATADRVRLYLATLSATWLLDVLTQGKLHGEECWVEDYQVNTCDIRLRRGPVVSITSVTQVSRCNVESDLAIDWCWKSSRVVSVCCNGCTWTQFSCGCDNNVVRIQYEIGSNLPPGTASLIAWLAIEYGKAAQGQACSLPERITNITRQGVSWTVLDPQDFLDKNLTGIARIDNWLNAVRLTLGGSYIDPLTSNRLFSRRCAYPAPTPQ